MKCSYCEWRCDLADEKYGVCRMYHEEAGKVAERFPGKWSTYAVSRIESLPFYHAYPGSRSLTIGTTGCNLACRYCVNAFIAKEKPEELQGLMFAFTPEALVNMAIKRGCHNIVFNVNEPAVAFPSLLEVAKAARAAEIPMGCLTNAYTTIESTELLASIFSFVSISLKGLHGSNPPIRRSARDGKNVRGLSGGLAESCRISRPCMSGTGDRLSPGQSGAGGAGV